MYALTRLFSRFLKEGVFDYCQLETNENEHALVTKDGGLVSYIEVQGNYLTLGDNELQKTIGLIVSNIKGIFTKPGFRIDFVFVKDPAISRKQIAAQVERSLNTMRRLDLDLETILQERIEVMSERSVPESCYLVVRTSINVLEKEQVGKALKARLHAASEAGAVLKGGEFGQSPFIVAREVAFRHTEFIESLIDFIKPMCLVRRMTVVEGLRATKSAIDPEIADGWTPSLLMNRKVQDPASPSNVRDKQAKREPVRRFRMNLTKESPAPGDISHIVDPEIAFQLFNAHPRISEEDPSIVRMGPRYMAPLFLEQAPVDPRPFSELFAKIKPTTPWRLVFSMTSGSDAVFSKIATKESIARIISWANSGNKAIIRAAEDFRVRVEQDHDILVACSMSLCTWGNSYEEVTRNKISLTQSVESWGQCSVIDERGDAIEGWLSTVPGFVAEPISNVFAMIIEEAFYMMPLTRPASPWADGSILYRTKDRKLFPYYPGSSQQTTWVDLYFAPPGMGKSFALAAANLAFILSPGNLRMPRLGIIDIGPSSSAQIDLIREALPPHKRHLAQSYKVEMSKEFSFNPFDTPLGCRRPLALDREWLVNFLSLLLSPAGMSESIPRLPEIVSALVDGMYSAFADEGKPNPYEPGVDKEVDAAIAAKNIRLHRNTTWWQIVDALHLEHGDSHPAMLAQRYAMPTLNDATGVLFGNKSIGDIYGSAMINGAENLMDFLKTMLVTVAKDYSIVSSYTRFDIGSARIISMDLSAVAKTGSASAEKKTAVMYMLARQMIGKDFFRNEKETLQEIPGPYRAYHAEVFKLDAEVPKKLAMDEYHRTAKSIQVRDQTLIDIREGRKFNVHVALLSQMVDDFDSAMVQLATNIYILSSGTEKTRDTILENFAPHKDSMAALIRYCRGPGPEGSSMLYLGTVKDVGRIEQILYLTLGPQEVWAYSTTHEDILLRRKLTERVGLSQALRMLAERFKGGSAKSKVEALALSKGADPTKIDENESIFDDLVNDIILGKA